ncbi:Transposase IS116/IS110/IS902 family [Cedecea lapagei]|uniref:Transposase IS116/IS110/IS902 family n=1 Tax=Cedecea lapagei TaxID=158823 RepID=A0A3S4IKC1_9ENTR|nr:IS110 family transposase [Cedecea lapagei]VEB95345.1 Transposase IS116/IS110/IS902 family [Cedecea lapagei]
MTNITCSCDTPVTRIAIDIAKKYHDAKIKRSDGRIVYLCFENSLAGYARLITATRSSGEKVVVAFEPTADYHRNIAWWLQEQGIECRLVSSLACARAREMLFKTWDKNDRKDASVILYLMEQGLSSPFFDPLLNKMMDIQEISNTYYQISLARTRSLNSLVNHYLTLYFPEAEQFLHQSRTEWFCHFLLRFPTPQTITSIQKSLFVKEAWDIIGRKQYKQQFLEQLYEIAHNSIALPLPENCEAVVTFKLQIRRYIELTLQQLQLEKMAENYLQNRADYHHLRSLPGVGPVIAMMILAESGDLNRFAHYRQYLNFCGFNLSASQSGEKCSSYRLSKRGNARLRYAFWLAATVAVRMQENTLRNKYERYIREHGDNPDQRRKAVVAVATKLARIAHSLVKKDVDYQRYFDISHGT